MFFRARQNELFLVKIFPEEMLNTEVDFASMVKEHLISLCYPFAYATKLHFLWGCRQAHSRTGTLFALKAKTTVNRTADFGLACFFERLPALSTLISHSKLILLQICRHDLFTLEYFYMYFLQFFYNLSILFSFYQPFV